MEGNTMITKGEFCMRWYFKAIRNYLNFEDRARRLEFWMFIFINALIFGVLDYWQTSKGWGTLLTGFYSLFIFFPGMAVGIRRLHDIGKSGWWVLIGFIPVIGPFILFLWSMYPSEEGSNRYGPAPKITA
jgi:uncharacterized membrane protein YhaH (DUF805 family)